MQSGSMQLLGSSSSARARSAGVSTLHYTNQHAGISQRMKCSVCKSIADHAVQAVSTHLPQAAAMAAASVLVGSAVVDAVAAELQPKKCKTCLGTGFLICIECQGRGKLGLSLPGEPAVVSHCTSCNKRGRCRCDRCKATGLENNWLWQPAADPGWGPRGN